MRRAVREKSRHVREDKAEGAEKGQLRGGLAGSPGRSVPHPATGTDAPGGPRLGWTQPGGVSDGRLVHQHGSRNAKRGDDAIHRNGTGDGTSRNCGAMRNGDTHGGKGAEGTCERPPDTGPQLWGAQCHDPSSAPGRITLTLTYQLGATGI